MNIARMAACFVIAVSLAACSTTPVVLTYTPNAAVTIPAETHDSIVVGVVTDSRKQDGTHLGSIRTGFGSPLKTLETQQPVSEVVRQALVDGLKSARLLTDMHPKYTLNVDVSRFDCNQLARREAHIVLVVSVVEVASKRTVYSKTIKSDKVTGSMITFDAGIFASVDDLRQVANDVLQDAVDQLLADHAFVSSLR